MKKREEEEAKSARRNIDSRVDGDKEGKLKKNKEIIIERRARDSID
jgi:hypothetical protein